ncbi:MAG: carboxymuconolactone decarboxylase family protein [Calditrichaeota bacterium]|nr:carboxymuconolactone decarboxylase family protein [Candidatus Cloacimonadota bacterium]MCB1046391.1 carboxymuconolactone decarboxylase family protein [Calditrichota bacterium]
MGSEHTERLEPGTLLELVRCSLELQAGHLESAAVTLRALVHRGTNPRALREWALQLLIFDGYPTTIEALRLLMEALPPELALELAHEDLESPDADTRRGEELFARVYGPHAPIVKAALGARSTLLLRWILEHGYGRVLSRPDLAAADRELLAVCILARKGWRQQLRAHLRGAHSCGARRDELEQVLGVACSDTGLLDESLKLVERICKAE